MGTQILQKRNVQGFLHSRMTSGLSWGLAQTQMGGLWIVTTRVSDAVGLSDGTPTFPRRLHTRSNL